MLYLTVFLVGSAGYGLLEMLWRGYTHWTMLITGGVCFLSVYLINSHFGFLNIFTRCLISAAAITLLEFAVGCTVNLALGWHVWDYSKMPFNLLGQICLPYFLLWFALSFGLVFLCGEIGKLYA